MLLVVTRICRSTAKEYRAYERDMREKMYSEIVERCGEYDRKQKNKEMER